jgi:hypothetical protein
MTWVAVAIGGSAVLGYMGSRRQASAAESAAALVKLKPQVMQRNFSVKQSKESLAFQREMYEKGLTLGEPYREAGYGALTRIGELLPGLTAPVSREEIMGLPGYQFAMEQGVGSARQMANVGGGGSNVDRAAQKFAIDYTLGTAMPQVISQRQNIYNTLAGIAGIGQTSTTGAIGAGQQYGANVANISGATAGALSNLAVGGATAAGAGQIGAANAYASGMSNIGNSALMYALLKG